MKSFFLIFTFVLLFCALINPIVLAESMLELDFIVEEDGKATLYNLRTYLGSAERAKVNGTDYQFLVYSQEGEVLQSLYLPVYFYLLDPWVKVTQVPLSVKVPYSQNYKVAGVYNNGSWIFTEDISYLCQKDGICQEKENYASCPEDCTSGSLDGLCDRQMDEKCDPDCLKGDKDCSILSILLLNSLGWVSFGLSLVALAFLFFFLFKFWKEGDKAKQREYWQKAKISILVLVGIVGLSLVVWLILKFFS